MKNPLVSVIVPNYNHAPFLEKRLQSIFNQTFQDYEVILLDDGSTDSSRNILGEYEDHSKVSHCIFNDKNSGLPFKQWQKGIKLAKGRYIWIAESDDWAESIFLEKLVPHLNEKTGIVFCKSYTFFDREKELSKYYFPEDLFPERWHESAGFEGRELLDHYHVYVNTIPNASACLFEKKLAKTDEILTGLSFCGDWLFWARMMTETNVFFLSDRMNYWRLSDSTVRAKKKPELEEKRYHELLFCMNSIISLSNRDYVDLSNYNWLFHHYFSTQPMWKIAFLKKPDIPVSTFLFKMYLYRSAGYLFLKRVFGLFKKISFTN